nr:MAG TPA: hypothetical protein [Caudoviricetes sp.]
MEKKVEYYTIRPSLKQYFGRKVNKSLKFDETTEDGKVHQVLDNLILTTTIKEERKMKMLINGVEQEITTQEDGTIVQKLHTGLILIWDEKQGYVIPPYQMATLDEIQEDLTAMKEAYRSDV